MNDRLSIADIGDVRYVDLRAIPTARLLSPAISARVRSAAESAPPPAPTVVTLVLPREVGAYLEREPPSAGYLVLERLAGVRGSLRTFVFVEGGLAAVELARSLGLEPLLALPIVFDGAERIEVRTLLDRALR